MATIFRAPTFAPHQRKKADQSPDICFRNALLFAVAVVAPFSGSVQDVPARAKQRQQESTLGIPLALRTAPVLTPSTQTEWPNPIGARGRQQDTTAGIPLVIRSASSVAPFVQTDWPNPESRQRYLDAHVLYTAAYEVAADPFVVQVTENPVPRAPSRQQEGDWTTFRGLLAATPAPFAQYDWPVPIKARQRPQESTSSMSLLARTAPILTPFAQTEWPNPVQKKRPLFDEWLYSSQLTTLAPPPPFTVYDWPITPRAKQRAQDGNWSAYQPLLAVPKPFVQCDWPVTPRADQRPQESTQGASIALLTWVNVKPFKQNDWPNPEQIRINLEDHGWTISAPLALGIALPPEETPLTDFGNSQRSTRVMRRNSTARVGRPNRTEKA